MQVLLPRVAKATVELERVADDQALALARDRLREMHRLGPDRIALGDRDSGVVTERGRALHGEVHVGEAMLETMKPDEDRLVPYAVELGVHVLYNIDSHDETVHRVVIRRGQLKAHYVQVRKTTYTLNNKSDEEQIVFFETKIRPVLFPLIVL